VHFSLFFSVRMCAYCACLRVLQIQAGASFCGEEISAFTGRSLAVDSRLDFIVCKNRPLNLLTNCPLTCTRCTESKCRPTVKWLKISSFMHITDRKFTLTENNAFNIGFSWPKLLKSFLMERETTLQAAQIT